MCIKDRLKKGGLALINSPGRPRSREGVRLYYVNATRIALDLGLVLAGWPLVNVAMVGALSRVLGLNLESVLSSVRGMLSGRLAELNVEAARRAYLEVMGVDGA